jgi:hypothetical protein
MVAAASTARRIVSSLGIGALALAAAAFACTSAMGLVAGEASSTVLLGAHLVQGAAALALALGGAVLACWFRHPLDAAGLSVALTGLGSFGLLAGGILVERLPRTLVEWALGASPLVAVATAGRIDVLRTDLVYQISSLAHVQTQLPSWPVVLATYLSIAAACALVLVRLSSEPNAAPLQPILGKDIA